MTDPEWVPVGGIGLTFGVAAHYFPAMRVLGFLLLMGIGLGIGSAPMLADAEPCHFHTHEGATIESGISNAGAALISTAIGDKPFVVADFDDLELNSSHTNPGHAVPVEEICCHVAAAVMLAVDPTVEPHLLSIGRSSLPLVLPPWASPLSDIYRPPALS